MARVQGCGVIAEKDAEFGRVLTPVPVVSSVLPSQRVDQDKLTHLSVSKRTQLCQLLDEFADCFVDKPGLCEGYRSFTKFRLRISVILLFYFITASVRSC